MRVSSASALCIKAKISGDTAAVTANPTEVGAALDFVLPVGATGPQGEQGVQGDTGAVGATGPAPEMTVSEDTATSYKVSFKTADQEIVSPNLKANLDCYNINLSALNSTKDIALGSLILTIQNTSATSVRLSVRAANADAPVLADIRRASIYNGGTVEAQTNDNVTVKNTLVLDDLIYSQSQEMHWTRIRQQDPTSGLWSMCQVYTFISQGGARTSVCINWFYTGATFQTP